MYTAVTPPAACLRSRGGVGAVKTKDPLYIPYDMAKELGQIHTVNYTQAIANTGSPQNAVLVDLPGQLTNQLQTLVRWGTYHKVVGIDITLDNAQVVGVDKRGGQVTGYIRYYAPTKGRCEAVRGAFDAMKTVMKNQGISMSDNRMYDFKAPINELSHASGVFPNQATLDGVSGLALFNTATPTASIFNVHNESVRPTETGAAADLYSSGFATLINPAGGTDFVLNDEAAYSGNRDGASTEYETIPFQLTFDPTTGNVSTFQWRPDPALFLAVLCGQMSVVVDAVYFEGLPTPPTQIDLNLSVMVSGWKSIMSKPRARKSSARAKKMK